MDKMRLAVAVLLSGWLVVCAQERDSFTDGSSIPNLTVCFVAQRNKVTIVDSKGGEYIIEGSEVELALLKVRLIKFIYDLSTVLNNTDSSAFTLRIGAGNTIKMAGKDTTILGSRLKVTDSFGAIDDDAISRPISGSEVNDFDDFTLLMETVGDLMKGVRKMMLQETAGVVGSEDDQGNGEEEGFPLPESVQQKEDSLISLAFPGGLNPDDNSGNAQVNSQVAVDGNKQPIQIPENAAPGSDIDDGLTNVFDDKVSTLDTIAVPSFPVHFLPGSFNVAPTTQTIQSAGAGDAFFGVEFGDAFSGVQKLKETIFTPPVKETSTFTTDQSSTSSFGGYPYPNALPETHAHVAPLSSSMQGGSTSNSAFRLPTIPALNKNPSRAEFPSAIPNRFVRSTNGNVPNTDVIPHSALEIPDTGKLNGLPIPLPLERTVDATEGKKISKRHITLVKVGLGGSVPVLHGGLHGGVIKTIHHGKSHSGVGVGLIGGPHGALVGNIGHILGGGLQGSISPYGIQGSIGGAIG